VALLPTMLMAVAPRASTPSGIATKVINPAIRASVAILIAFLVLVALRSSIQAAFAAFLPKVFADRGWEPTAYGVLAGTFMLAAAVGNLALGVFADRYGIRAATIWPLLLSIPAGLVCLWAPTATLAFVGCALAGFLVGGQHSVLVVHAQRLIPARQGFAAGLILGFTFASGAVGIWVGGLAADYWGLTKVMQALTLLALPAAVLSLTLPSHERRMPVVAPAAPNI
jgi:FSR family fosmidomycin resistance protein-like MFS transporter